MHFLIIYIDLPANSLQSRAGADVWSNLKTSYLYIIYHYTCKSLKHKYIYILYIYIPTSMLECLLYIHCRYLRCIYNIDGMIYIYMTDISNSCIFTVSWAHVIGILIFFITGAFCRHSNWGKKKFWAQDRHSKFQSVGIQSSPSKYKR